MRAVVIEDFNGSIELVRDLDTSVYRGRQYL